MAMVYKCDGYQPIRSDKIDDTGSPAKMFASRLARREFGKRGYCRTLRLDNWSEDGSRKTYEAFIGRTPKHDHNATEGRNVWLTVHATED